MNDHDDALPQRPSLAPAVRIGDAERERAVTALSEHYGAGRLDRGELDVRAEAAYRATTGDELAVLFDDLPDPAPFRRRRPGLRTYSLPRAPSRQRRQRVPMFPLVPILVLLGVLGVLVASGGRGFLFLPMVWLWFGFVRRSWHPPRG
jgi:uncharacterized protein DUF1707